MKMSRILIMIFFIAAPLAKADMISDILSSDLPKDARWSFSVYDMATGKETFHSGNAADSPLVPGSLIKLFVAAAVLEEKEQGRVIPLTTSIYVSRKTKNAAPDLYICGKGNAFLSTDDLRRAVETLSKKGIGKVRNIIVDTGYFDTSGFSSTRKGPGYASPAPFGLDLQTVSLAVSPTEDGRPPQIDIYPPVENVSLAISARTSNVTASEVKVSQIDDLTYNITGNIPVTSPPLKWRFAVQDSSLFAGGVIKGLLREQGFSVAGDLVKGKIPPDAVLVAVLQSPPLEQVLRDMNFHSLNVVADTLFLALGAEKIGQPGTIGKGREALLQTLKSFFLERKAVKIADGSGLSAENRVTARGMASFLVEAGKHQWFSVFYDSLPILGREGTVANMKFISADFRVKTGILEDVYAIAGYGINKGGRAVSFTYIVNAPGAALIAPATGEKVIQLIIDDVITQLP